MLNNYNKPKQSFCQLIFIPAFIVYLFICYEDHRKFIFSTQGSNNIFPKNVTVISNVCVRVVIDEEKNNHYDLLKYLPEVH